MRLTLTAAGEGETVPRLPGGPGNGTAQFMAGFLKGESVKRNLEKGRFCFYKNGGVAFPDITRSSRKPHKH